jgi:hypothetical protein
MCRIFCPILTRLGFPTPIFIKYSTSNFTKIRRVRMALKHADGRTDGRTDGHDEGNRRFSLQCEHAYWLENKKLHKDFIAELTTGTQIIILSLNAQPRLEWIFRICSLELLLHWFQHPNATEQCISWSISSDGLLRSVWWFDTDVSGLQIGPICKGEIVQAACTAWILKMGPTCGPETSVSNHRTLRNNPEDGRLCYNHGASLRSQLFDGTTRISCASTGKRLKKLRSGDLGGQNYKTPWPIRRV